MPKFDMPYKIVEDDRLRPGGARSVGRGGQGQGERRRSADAASAASTTPSCSRAKWSSSAGRRWRIMSLGPGWYEEQYLKTLGKLSDGPISFVPWYDPNKQLTQDARGGAGQGLSGRQPEHQPRLHVRGAADRRRRLQARRLGRPEGARRCDPQDQHHRQRDASAPGIQFNAKGQNDKLEDLPPSRTAAASS